MGSLGVPKNATKSVKQETQNNTFSTTPMHHPLQSPSRHLNLLSVLFLLGLGFVLGILSSFYVDTSPSSLRSSRNFVQILSSTPPPPPPSMPPPSLPPPSQPKQQSAKFVTSSTTPSLDNKTTNDPYEQSGLRRYLEPRKAMHDMTEEELFWRASMVPQISKTPFKRVPKVAFLFLTRGEIPFAELWDLFFKGHEDLYSIYWHTDPSFNGSVPENSVFHGRRIPSKEVQWGHISMMEAERRLLANALLNFANERFILLSESHVPLFNFPTVYSYVINSSQVYLESYDEPGPTGRGRYQKGMYPHIKINQWRKGSQWFEIDRKIAVDVVSDEIYFPLFKKKCKGNCYTDEHYLPTFLHIKYRWALSNRTLTWVDWSRGGPHPARYTRMEVTLDFLHWLRNGHSCTYNGNQTRVCFLFARKFLPNSLTRFLRFAPKVMGFG
ncbi:hypothetical protein LUZ63_014866 [Rhynchospora breviuscula]|uniref:Uncharacterized protein n=1 Tax=Rhynchospora breviuscula TaxID=2022672 RepID=A0A9Q0CBA2_9POAL|nr:hypothetical protein LUZ63_014866 [Rhynchospora breviuscula]